MVCTRASPANVTVTSGGHESAGGRAKRAEKLRKESKIVVRRREGHANELQNGRKWMRQQEVQVMD